MLHKYSPDGKIQMSSVNRNAAVQLLEAAITLHYKRERNKMSCSQMAIFTGMHINLVGGVGTKLEPSTLNSNS